MDELKRVLTLGSKQFDELCAQSRFDDRLRTHCNLHASLDAPVQQLLVAIQPQSYLRPHRHSSPPKEKCYIALKGAVGVIWFAETGKVVGHERLTPLGPTSIVVIPTAVWHTIVALSADTLLLEVKSGPYSPLAENDLASWAPHPETPAAAQFIDGLYSLFLGCDTCS